jgi:NitT/TauT family transport system ATP-binding protein
MEKLLSLSSIKLIYQSKTSETLAIDNLSFDVSKEEFIAIVGPSGCGKTTLLSLICGLIRPTSGTITIAGENVTRPSSKAAYMFQRDNLFEWLTISKNVMLGLEIMHKKNAQTKEYAGKLLQKYGLAEFAKSYPSQLSGGMRQRVALIRTLATEPELLLLDEPFSALDYQTRLMVQGDIHSIIKQEKKTAILVTHDIAEAICMADRIIVLSPRPGTVKKIISLDFDKSLSPFERRKQPVFNKYFNMVWGELS